MLSFSLAFCTTDWKSNCWRAPNASSPLASTSYFCSCKLFHADASTFISKFPPLGRCLDWCVLPYYGVEDHLKKAKIEENMTARGSREKGPHSHETTIRPVVGFSISRGDSTGNCKIYIVRMNKTSLWSFVFINTHEGDFYPARNRCTMCQCACANYLLWFQPWRRVHTAYTNTFKLPSSWPPIPRKSLCAICSVTIENCSSTFF